MLAQTNGRMVQTITKQVKFLKDPILRSPAKAFNFVTLANQYSVLLAFVLV